jgi:hypothetical protein
MVLYSMASDRSTYDQGSFMVKTKESIKPLSYILEIQAHENCTPCGDKPNVSVHEERVNLESDLFGINRKLSKDPKQKYQKNDKIADVLNYNPPYLCERYITSPGFRDQNTGNKYMEDLKKTAVAVQ